MLTIIHCPKMDEYTPSMEDYNLRFNYIPGETNVVADAFSWRSDYEIDFVAQKSKTSDLIYSNSKDVSRIRIPNDNVQVQIKKWNLVGIARQRSQRTPGNREKRLGREKIHWRNMTHRITEYIEICQVRQRSKVRTGKAPGHLRPLEISTAKWESIGMDFIIGLSMNNNNNNDAIMAIDDRFTKRIAHVGLNPYVQYHGILWDITSDRDIKFTSKFWQSCVKLTGTKQRMTAAYQQRTDGQVERINAIVAAYLRSYVG
ncbi:LOW QUALITY PROTEIN: Retrotransposon protein, Ty3-gypsy sub-class [Phytophthora palmivora]|uniref:Retrotransposon protein, Ty3-gypsy sub-class n=1 Tax=Phytophthora palmivora TaxID=4796 RepID=A0A2P4XGA0_9STRA|nr:LOW QUALITY PROTEIN: Retrotransposon protein, Ty3-gypsy sub-class [Phytophthora palmivora]